MKTPFGDFKDNDEYIGHLKKWIKDTKTGIKSFGEDARLLQLLKDFVTDENMEITLDKDSHDFKRILEILDFNINLCKEQQDEQEGALEDYEKKLMEVAS